MIGGNSENGRGLFLRLGVRGYLDYTFIFKSTGETWEGWKDDVVLNAFDSTHAVTLNADLLVNIIQTDSVSFGAFVGIGLGYGMTIQTSTNGGVTKDVRKADGFILPVNVGLSLTANHHHRFELGFKIPTLGIAPSLEGGEVVSPNTYETNMVRYFTTSVGYSYIF